MANEIQVALSLGFTKGVVSATSVLSTTNFTMAGTNYSQGTLVTNNSTVTAIPLGSIGTPGFLFIKNNDTTNKVDFYPTTGGVASATIQPGMGILVFCNGASPGLKAEAGTPVVNFLLLEA